MINPPVIVIDDGDMMVFSSKEFAEEYIEPQDIHTYEAFDSLGTKLVLSLKKITDRAFWVEISLEEIIMNDYLRNKIINYLRRIQSVDRSPFTQRNWDQFTLSELIKVLTEVALIK